MNQATIVRRLRKHLPRTAQEILDKCELPLQYIGGGSFRYVYHVLGTQTVIKVPRKGTTFRDTQVNIQHAKDEYDIWKRITASKRKYKELKKYMPEFIYYNSESGIIVVRKYEEVKYSRELCALIGELDDMVTSITGTKDTDLHSGNLGIDQKGNVKIIDMGLFIHGFA